MLPLSNWQRCQKFGRFKFRPNPVPGNPECITILEGWAVQNIADVRCDQLIELFKRDHVNLHHMAKDPFLALWKAWDKAGLLQYVETWNGSFVPRYKRGRAPKPVAGVPVKAQFANAALSNHSWGTAFDINAKAYPLGKVVPAGDAMRELALVANEHRWFWGGDFKSRPDGMHFEYVGRP